MLIGFTVPVAVPVRADLLLEQDCGAKGRPVAGHHGLRGVEPIQNQRAKGLTGNLIYYMFVTITIGS